MKRKFRFIMHKAKSLYVFVPINLNSASDETLLSIPELTPNPQVKRKILSDNPRRFYGI